MDAPPIAEPVCLAYVTAPDAARAEDLGRTLVEERLAACANILPGMRSWYWWEGRMESADEAVLILKTVAGRLEALIARVRALHPYACPCVLAWTAGAGNPDYLDWVRAAATAPAPSPPG